MRDGDLWLETVHELSAREFIKKHFPEAFATNQRFGKTYDYLSVRIPYEQRDEFYAKMIAGGYDLLCHNLCMMSYDQSNNALIYKWYQMAEEVKV